MSRKKLPEVAPRTIRLHIPTYNAILDFFSMSPAGLSGSDAIRQLLYHYGTYCQEQMQAGRQATSVDLKAAEDAVYKLLGDSNGITKSNPNDKA